MSSRRVSVSHSTTPFPPSATPPSDTSAERDALQNVQLPWWKKPSPWWLLSTIPISAIAMSATLGPRIEIYTRLVCNVLKPEYAAEPQMLSSLNGHISGVALFSLNDPSLGRCASDPVIQAAVARLSAALTASLGILSCMTAAGWGSYSDRQGRVQTMGISLIGLVLADVVFILVAWFAPFLPGNYWFLLLGPILEGALGGLASAIASNTAYIADCALPSSRSHLYSLFVGLLMSGIAIGPFFGALLIRASHQLLSVFYGALAWHILFTLFMWFFVPESLSKVQMADSMRRHRMSGGRGWRKTMSLLAPLSVFTPKKLQESRGGKSGRDWNMLLFVAGYASMISIMGSYSYKFQYVIYAFGWTSETIGYWLTLTGSIRAIFLVLILPVLIKLFKPVPPPIQLPGELSDPLNTFSPEPGSPRLPTPSKNLTFDLALARISLLLEFVSYFAIGLVRTPLGFTLFTVLEAFSSGFSPVAKSVALDLYDLRERMNGVLPADVEIGKLLGALSVVYALSFQVLGPALFGITYMTTVAVFPRAMFFLAAAAAAIPLFLFSFLRLSEPIAPAGAEGQEQGDVPIPGQDPHHQDADVDVSPRFG